MSSGISKLGTLARMDLGGVSDLGAQVGEFGFELCCAAQPLDHFLFHSVRLGPQPHDLGNMAGAAGHIR